MNHKYTNYLIIILMILGLLVSGNVSAGALTNASITPAVTTLGTVTEYTIKFDSFSVIGPNDNIYVTTSGSGTGIGTNFSGPGGFSTIIQPATLTLLGTTNSGTEAKSNVNIGSAGAITTVEFVLSSVTNPTSSGVSPSYTISVGINNGLRRDSVIVSGLVFSAPSINIFVDGFEDLMIMRVAKNTIALINILSSTTESITSISQEGEQYQFMGESLSLKSSGQARGLGEVLAWYKMILSEKSPMMDFDNDGISNEFDADPFGLSFIK